MKYYYKKNIVVYYFVKTKLKKEKKFKTREG